MANERYTDLPCRVKCPFYWGRLDKGLRPCVVKVKENEPNCSQQIRNHFSPDNHKAVTFEFLPKRLDIFVNHKTIGEVHNGIAVFFKTQS